ncbi:hypothetical protein ACFFRR_009561 [Megaselia abdita]
MQENAQLQIPPSLLECYQNGTYLYRDNRLPMTLDVLISLIEKVENTQNYNNDIRQVSIQLIQRFRQDGIERAYNVNAGPSVIPYSPIGFQFSKFRILLSRLIPGNAFTFPNSTLTRQERCTLHFMLSSSFDLRNRGDEGQTCSRISQYRSNRLPRSLRNNFKGDVEILHDFDIKQNSGNQRTNPYNLQDNSREFDDQPFLKSPKNNSREPNGNPRHNKNSVDFVYGGNNNNNGYGNSNQISSCPVENGVIRTPYGTVSPGTVIAGIAAGLEYQSIQLTQLLQLSRRGRVGNFQQQNNYYVDNRYAATLAGDLAEVALVQVPTSQNGVTIGANGGWNNTAYPEWYFLQQNSDLEMTDAEIRGGLDGLILSMNVQNWKSQSSNLRLSQVLRMYYSNNGVLGTNIMACNRKQLFSTYAPSQTLQEQTAAFAQLLDREMQLQVTLLPEAIVNFSMQASSALSNYIPNNLNDVSCSAVIDPGNTGSNSNNDNSSTLATDLIIFYDPSNNYNDVSPAISYIVNNLNMGDFPSGSTVSMINTFDGSVIVNRTHFSAEFYGNFTPSRFNNNYWSGGNSFNLGNVFNRALNMSNSILNSEKYSQSIGGKSMVALVIPGNGQLNNNGNNMSPTYDNNGNPNYYLQRELQNLYEDAPDLYFIYYGTGNMQRFNNYVLNQQNDLYNLQPPAQGGSAASNANPVLQRISAIPRRIINYQCGAAWYQANPVQKIGKQFIVPGVLNFYRLHPNYFFGAYQQRFLKIQNSGYSAGSLTVCNSRSVVHPTQALQQSTNGISCQQLTNNNPLQIDLSNACSDASMIHFCSPVYISVYSANTNSGNTNNGNNGGNGYTNGNNNGYNGNNNNGYNGNTNGYNGNNNGNSNGYNGNSNGYNGNNNGYNVNNNGNNGNNNGASTSNSPIQVTCTDPLCPLPNMIMFNIEVDNLGCYSASKKLISSTFLVFFAAFMINRFL